VSGLVKVSIYFAEW